MCMINVICNRLLSPLIFIHHGGIYQSHAPEAPEHPHTHCLAAVSIWTVVDNEIP